MSVRIGGGQGFYGDGHAPIADLLESGLDYLVCEALAELTLAILQKDRQRDEALGYARDLPLYVGEALPYLLDGRTKARGIVDPKRVEDHLRRVASGERGGGSFATYLIWYLTNLELWHRVFIDASAAPARRTNDCPPPPPGVGTRASHPSP